MEHPNIIRSFCKGFCLVALLWLFRSWYTHTLFYGFLLWNLVLAYIPYAISQYLTTTACNKKHSHKATIHPLKWWVLFALWLLFFPNSPYIVTDLIHLAKRNDIPKWYDAAMLFCAASTGLWIGCLSLLQMELLWRQQVPRIKTGFFILMVLLLCGFGIYLGRVMRFNSWDMLTNPFVLIKAVGNRFIFPWQHLRTWFITFLFAAVLGVGYSQVKQIISFSSKQA